MKDLVILARRCLPNENCFSIVPRISSLLDEISNCWNRKAINRQTDIQSQISLLAKCWNEERERRETKTTFLVWKIATKNGHVFGEDNRESDIIFNVDVLDRKRIRVAGRDIRLWNSRPTLDDGENILSPILSLEKITRDALHSVW